MSTPVPGTGRPRWHSRKNRAGRPNGLLSASRIIPHRYADEGDKGPWFRRIVRRREARLWKKEADQ
ncbi:hypothetical protein CP967_31255 [Streptomyces nitrosporeus]|uniref:Uncharacterized protein n=1 Tax=Streptomyces nitrosporeus TaxID=28894 RepID=A0A5J6FPT2_9ACTN|nr:hypothetical protein CP967_31255 [Streptomyces nitrosporeus]GGY88777.1 hypothetical protein GCM10010327_19380 [Streptomyces nitrosporeus]